MNHFIGCPECQCDSCEKAKAKQQRELVERWVRKALGDHPYRKIKTDHIMAEYDAEQEAK